MEERQKRELLRMTAGRIRFDEPMDLRTTFRVGGKAEALYEAGEGDELVNVLGFLASEEIPHLVLGRGSNLLVRDGGIRGVVILLSGSFARMGHGEAHYREVVAGAGLSLVDLLIWCRNHGVSGLEFLAGIPGSVGGAVRMNAGAFGRETGQRVGEIRYMGPKGRWAVSAGSGLRFSYRDLEIEEGALITEVIFRLDRDHPERVSREIARCLKRRRETQPLEYPSAGSVFKNPPGGHAARLIDQAGLKGTAVGGATVSHKHANFIINRGGATASDILTLISLIREEIERRWGIELELEIRVVGEPQGGVRKDISCTECCEDL